MPQSGGLWLAASLDGGDLLRNNYFYKIMESGRKFLPLYFCNIIVTRGMIDCKIRKKDPAGDLRMFPRYNAHDAVGPSPHNGRIRSHKWNR